MVGAVLPTVDARTPLPPPATTGGMPVEIQVQIDRSGYYLGTAMLLFVVLLWILVCLSLSPISLHARRCLTILFQSTGELPYER